MAEETIWARGLSSTPTTPSTSKNYMNGHLEDGFGAIDDVDLSISNAFAEALGLEGGEVR